MLMKVKRRLSPAALCDYRSSPLGGAVGLVTLAGAAIPISELPLCVITQKTGCCRDRLLFMNEST